MTDFYDRASALEEQQRQWAIDRQRTHSAGSDIGAVDCTDCGDAIDPARRIAVPGCCRCIDCQTAADSRYKLTR